MRRTHCDRILAILAIVRIVEVDWDTTGAQLSTFEYERSNIISIAPTSGVARNGAERTEVTKGDHDEISPIYGEKFANREMCGDLTESVWHRFLDKGEDYTEYPREDMRSRVTGYCSSAVVFEEVQEI